MNIYRIARHLAHLTCALGLTLGIQSAHAATGWQINPEEALHGSNRKFERRVRAIEEELKRQGKTWATSTLAEMEAFYQAAKQRETGEPNNV